MLFPSPEIIKLYFLGPCELDHRILGSFVQTMPGDEGPSEVMRHLNPVAVELRELCSGSSLSPGCLLFSPPAWSSPRAGPRSLLPS